MQIKGTVYYTEHSLLMFEHIFSLYELVKFSKESLYIQGHFDLDKEYTPEIYFLKGTLKLIAGLWVSCRTNYQVPMYLF